jgi:uncharacterized protein
MNTKILLLLTFWLCGDILNAQTSLLYEISGNGSAGSSYVFGTIHMIPKKQFFFNDTMKEKFLTCKKLVLEVDITALTLRDQIEMGQKAILPNGESLRSLMGEDAYQQFRQYLTDTMGIKGKKIDNQYNRIKPFFLTSLILKEKIGKFKVYEMELAKMAKKRKMNVGSLETLGFQMSLVEAIPLETQIELFLDVSAVQDYDSLLIYYLNQDIDGLHRFSEKEISKDEYQDFNREFVLNRNMSWIPAMTTMMTEQPVFFAVGALHLPGENGVLNLLRKQGYRVEPVKQGL